VADCGTEIGAAFIAGNVSLAGGIGCIGWFIADPPVTSAFNADWSGGISPAAWPKSLSRGRASSVPVIAPAAPAGPVAVTRFFSGGASALAGPAAGLTFGRTSGANWAFGAAASADSGVTSGAGAVGAERTCSGLGREGFGRSDSLVLNGNGGGNRAKKLTNSIAIITENSTGKTNRIIALRLITHLRHAENDTSN
jgi:hypothetical protein